MPDASLGVSAMGLSSPYVDSQQNMDLAIPGPFNTITVDLDQKNLLQRLYRGTK
jgi:hypothetical protein